MKSRPYSEDAGTGLTRPTATVVAFQPRLVITVEYGAAETIPARYADLQRTETDYAAIHPDHGTCDNCGQATCDHIWQVANPGRRYLVVDCDNKPRRGGSHA